MRYTRGSQSNKGDYFYSSFLYSSLNQELKFLDKLCWIIKADEDGYVIKEIDPRIIETLTLLLVFSISKLC
jgi:hypothetical protein